MIEIYLLEQLAAFREYGTLSAAAEHLHLSQPSLSRSMQKLEELLGVCLFERQKNRIVLNQTGVLAAEQAKHILESENNMVRQVRAFDRSLHTLTIGSCAPGPLMELLPQIAGLYTDKMVSSDVSTEESLLSGLHAGEYTAILLNHPLLGEEYFCQLHSSEQLYLSVTPFHPAAAYKKITFSEADGQNFIMYAGVGFWEGVVREKMPHAHFFKQEDLNAVGELTRSSDLPSFSTDITQRILESRRGNRINIPFSDPEAFAQYYLICLAKNKKQFQAIFG
jgi:DNA-binding transcriptional LysR family regulator